MFGHIRRNCSTLGSQWIHHRGYSENPVLNHPTLQSIAEKYGATVPQVVIQWAPRQGVMVLPASRNRFHQLSNINSFNFVLSDVEINAINGLDGNPPPLKEKIRSDANQVQVRFVNRANSPIKVYWAPGGSEMRRDEHNLQDHVPVGEMKDHGDVLSLTSYHGHMFIFREGGLDIGRILSQHVVDKSLGQMQNHEIEDMSEEL